MIKHDQKMIKKWKNMSKTRGKLHFFIFRKIFAPLEAKMMKNEKKWKNEKMKKKWKNPRKIAIFHFLENCNFPRFFFFFFSFFYHFFIIFHHFSSFFINSTTGSKNDKQMIKKMIKKWKNSRTIAIFYFSEKFCITGSKNDETW